MKVGRDTSQKGDMCELVFVYSTCVTEELSDFMLCSKTLSSASILRHCLSVGVACRFASRTPTRESMQIISRYNKNTRPAAQKGKQVLYLHCVLLCKRLTVKRPADMQESADGCKGGTSYPSDSSARSSVRSRSPSMMTSLRATCSCSIA